MHTYRNRPKGNYIQEARWQDLYLLTEKWKNNLEFHVLEIQFLERIIETYFVQLLLSKNLDQLRELQRNLRQTINRSKDLIKRSKLHMDHIVDILDEPYKYNASIFRVEHEQLEDDISNFITSQETVKTTVFNMTKDVLKNDKPKFIYKCN